MKLKEAEYHKNDPDWEGFWVQDAPREAVEYILSKPTSKGPHDMDNRSQWVWIRLTNGDLVLATYPQGDTYFSTEQWRTI